MRNEDVMYVDHEDIDEYRKQGWKESETGYYPGDYHARWGVIMFREIPATEQSCTPIVFLRRPANNKAELCIGMRDHKCFVFPISYGQVMALNEQFAEAGAKWPVQEIM